MPLYKTIRPNLETIIYVWKIEESFQELFRNVKLNETNLKRLNGMRSELHQRGFLSVRHLLKAAGYTDFDLYYTENGKPHLKDKKNISITHSFNFSAIAISDSEIGIDIEKNREKIKRIAQKFIDKETVFLKDKNIIEQLTVLWGAKESLYKIYPFEGLSFKKNVPIDAFDLKDKKTIGWIKTTDRNKKYDIRFERVENFTLVCALDTLKND